MENSKNFPQTYQWVFYQKLPSVDIVFTDNHPGVTHKSQIAKQGPLK